MTLTEFGDLVKSIQYKRGVEFRTDIDWMHGGRSFKFTMTCAVPDAGAPDKYISVHQAQWFDAESIKRMTADQVTDVIFDFVMAFERHEASEWFRVGGKQPYDPHRPPTVPGEEYGRD